MHDPLVVAFEIPRPWPRRLRAPARRRCWPSLVTVWHREPGDRDAFEVCKHRTHWKWHVHHWQIQVPPFQALRRRLLTYCAWCGGRDAPGDRVNHSFGVPAERGPWWQGERNLFHSDCSGMPGAVHVCVCTSPSLPDPRMTFGECQKCNRQCYGGRTDRQLDRLRLLQRVPFGVRPNRVPDLG